MPLPPKGDPRRPLHLAIRSTRLLGIVFCSLGILIMLATLLAPIPRRSMIGVAVLQSVVMLPGALYLIIAIFLRRRQPWAAVLGIVVAAMQGGAALCGMIVSLALTSSFETGEGPALATILLPILLLGLTVAAMIQLIFHLSKSFGAFRYAMPDEAHGFEPLPIAPAPQSQIADQKSEA